MCSCTRNATHRCVCGSPLAPLEPAWACSFNEFTNRVEFFCEEWLRELFDKNVFCALKVPIPARIPLGLIAFMYAAIQLRLVLSPAGQRGGAPRYGRPWLPYSSLVTQS